MAKFILAIDQGTTSSRAILFDTKLKPKATGQKEFKQYYPASGWVEHDAQEIWRSVISTCKTALRRAKAKDIAAIGITNQRETTVIWDRKTGKPLHKAIVWQDRRTADFCAKLKAQGHEMMVTQKTGLLLDPYFSATKLAWLLDNVEGARARAETGNLCFGTIDSFLIYNLTAGRIHATDATNAARTMLFNIHSGTWDEELLRLFDIPRTILPEVKDCAANFGHTDKKLFGAEIPIAGVAGDQHAALIGQACFAPGMMKSTYGTGCFAMLNTGDKPVASTTRMLTTLAYQLKGKRTYALEGAIFVAGASVQWLRDGLGLVKAAKETGALAAASNSSEQVYFIPAFVGLGAPYWQPNARGAIFGLTRGTTKKELARAALESVAYQTNDLLEAMKKDRPAAAGQTVLRVDGGMTASDYTMQALADILAAPVDRPKVLETTALGAAYLAGYQVGLLPEPKTFAKRWQKQKRFAPRMKSALRQEKLAGWAEAMRKLLA